MKTKICIIMLLCIFVCRDIRSQTVSPTTARHVAENFWQRGLDSEGQQPMQVRSFGNPEEPAMYAFSSQDNWVLIAGDMRMRPILACSDENGGPFPATEDMPPAMLYLLDWYTEQIEALRSDNFYRSYHPEWEVYTNANNRTANSRSIIIGPLLTRNGNENIWKQSGNNSGGSEEKSYNKFCPAGDYCNHTPTGCVATSMGQIMWYWQWPYAAVVEDDNDNDLLRVYDWDLMPHQLTDASALNEADMIANLLHDIGVAVNMNYGCSQSGASPNSIPSALIDAFGYNSSNLLERIYYTDNNWLALLKNELNNYRPVLYGGRNNPSSDTGHRFVIDGYNSDNLFHVNYGWGYGNGYYALDGTGYSASQTMVIYISPDYPQCSSIVIPSTNVWGTNFIIQNGGPITVGSRTVSHTMRGAIFSQESVKLTSGFKVENGAYLYIDIKDMNCSNSREEGSSSIIPEAPELKQTLQKILSPLNSSVLEPTKILRDGQLFIVHENGTYNAQGIKVE